jgi:hypothetical protein
MPQINQERFWPYARHVFTHRVTGQAKIGHMQAIEVVTEGRGYRWAMHVDAREVRTIKEIGVHEWPVLYFDNRPHEMRVICREDLGTPDGLIEIPHRTIYVGFVWYKALGLVEEYEMGQLTALLHNVV